MGTLTVRVTDAQGFLHRMLLPAMNVPRLGHYLFSGGTAAFKGKCTAIAKESYLDVCQFNIPLRKDTEYPTIDYLDLELPPRSSCQTEAAFPTKVISRHTIPTGLALVSRLLRSGAMGAVTPLATAARPLIATSTAAPGFPALQTNSYHARLISGGTMGRLLLPRGLRLSRRPRLREG